MRTPRIAGVLRRLTIHAPLVLLAACGAAPEEAAAPAVNAFLPADTANIWAGEAPPAVRLDTVAAGLEVPWALDFAPDGRIFVTERTGRVRVIQNGVLRREPWAELDVHAHYQDWHPESGLMGIALAPDFARTGHVYVVGTFPRQDGPVRRAWRAVAAKARSGPVLAWENRVYRLTDRGGRGVEPKLVISGIPAYHYHAGSAIAFGPDGMLYLTSGDVTDSGQSQDAESLAGKVLRFRPDGTIPADNPAPGSPVYARGFRNPQGLAWHPRTRELLAVEHGPTAMPHEGGRWGSDELNVVVPGGNYGWPAVAGRGGRAGFIDPVASWRMPIAPSGMAVYTGPESPWSGNLFVGGLRGEQLRRLALEPRPGGGWRVAGEQPLLEKRVGRIRAVKMGPDGHLYIATSNRDGRGTPRAGDDFLFRVVPQR